MRLSTLLHFFDSLAPGAVWKMSAENGGEGVSMESRTCPDCGARLNEKIHGLSRTVMCEMCDYRVASSIFNDIALDKTMYTIDVPLEENTGKMDVVVSYLHEATRETKARLNFNLKKHGRLRYEMTSLDAKIFIDKLDGNAVFLRVSPEFPFRSSH